MFKILTSLVVAAFGWITMTTPLDRATDAYVDKYRDLAIVEMYRSGVPASITLAQALHESSIGNSDLAIHANNHFGIKCKSYWTGKTYQHKDDDYDEDGNLMHSCFRSYDSVLDSYIDHTNFLKSSSNYRELFYYNQTDYTSWAHGLKKCGYATDGAYAQKLIDKINKYQLYVYDTYANPLKK